LNSQNFAIAADVLTQLSQWLLSQLNGLVLLIIGAFVGFFGKAILDRLGEPKLEMAGQTTYFDIRDFALSKVLTQQPNPPNPNNVILRCYRVKLTNKQKWFFNAPARNCVAWLDLDGEREPFQISWVGSNPSVTINVGDSREVDVCAVAQGLGIMIAPSERGYEAGARFLMLGQRPRTGNLRVTSENARLVTKKFQSQVTEDQMSLRITLGE
jgi:hypothetical protein